jgi:hypothetical protein
MQILDTKNLTNTIEWEDHHSQEAEYSDFFCLKIWHKRILRYQQFFISTFQKGKIL